MTKTLILSLVRDNCTDTYTEGRLYVADRFLCHTLEDPVRVLEDKNNDGDFDDKGEGKIYGNTAIPPGLYRVYLTVSKRFGRVLPELKDVPGFSGIRMHSGNSTNDTSGCILVGRRCANGLIDNSRVTEEKIVNILQMERARKHKLFIYINS